SQFPDQPTSQCGPSRVIRAAADTRGRGRPTSCRRSVDHTSRRPASGGTVCWHCLCARWLFGVQADGGLLTPRRTSGGLLTSSDSAAFGVLTICHGLLSDWRVHFPHLALCSLLRRLRRRGLFLRPSDHSKGSTRQRAG